MTEMVMKRKSGHPLGLGPVLRTSGSRLACPQLQGDGASTRLLGGGCRTTKKGQCPSPPRQIAPASAPVLVIVTVLQPSHRRQRSPLLPLLYLLHRLNSHKNHSNSQRHHHRHHRLQRDRLLRPHLSSRLAAPKLRGHHLRPVNAPICWHR